MSHITWNLGENSQAASVKRLSNVLHDIEDQDPNDNIGDQQKQALNDISKGCHDLLDELNRTLVKYQDIDPTARDATGVRRVGRRVWKRLIWDQKEIDVFRQRISANIDTFNLFLNEINSQLNKETKDLVVVTQQGVNQLVQHQDEQRRRDIFKWLSPVNHADKQAGFFGRVQEGTRTWLLDTNEFKNWITQDHDTPEDQYTLFCPELLGAGKTILKSAVINELQENL